MASLGWSSAIISPMKPPRWTGSLRRCCGACVLERFTQVGLGVVGGVGVLDDGDRVADAVRAGGVVVRYDTDEVVDGAEFAVAVQEYLERGRGAVGPREVAEHGHKVGKGGVLREVEKAHGRIVGERTLMRDGLNRLRGPGR